MFDVGMLQSEGGRELDALGGTPHGADLKSRYEAAKAKRLLSCIKLTQRAIMTYTRGED